MRILPNPAVGSVAAAVEAMHPGRPRIQLFFLRPPVRLSVPERSVILDRMSEVTRILSSIEQGDPTAAEQLLPLVYEELRQLAAQKLAQEKPDQTLQATALVHEAYLRLVGHGAEQSWNGRGHFFAAAAEAMRRILVESARRKKRGKHGGGRRRIDLEASCLATPDPQDDVEALDEALGHFEALDPLAARLVKLRFFAGLSMPQAAEAMGVSLRTAERNWAYARTWLHRAMAAESPAGPAPADPR
jgi:RNA polymerase sigma factor (TIGR02999 family)